MLGLLAVPLTHGALFAVYPALLATELLPGRGGAAEVAEARPVAARVAGANAERHMRVVVPHAVLLQHGVVGEACPPQEEAAAVANLLGHGPQGVIVMRREEVVVLRVGLSHEAELGRHVEVAVQDVDAFVFHGADHVPEERRGNERLLGGHIVEVQSGHGDVVHLRLCVMGAPRAEKLCPHDEHGQAPRLVASRLCHELLMLPGRLTEGGLSQAHREARVRARLDDVEIIIDALRDESVCLLEQENVERSSDEGRNVVLLLALAARVPPEHREVFLMLISGTSLLTLFGRVVPLTRVLGPMRERQLRRLRVGPACVAWLFPVCRY